MDINLFPWVIDLSVSESSDSTGWIWLNLVFVTIPVEETEAWLHESGSLVEPALVVGLNKDSWASLCLSLGHQKGKSNADCW
jgi:hypothetical protein